MKNPFHFPTALALLIIGFYISASTMQCTKVIPKTKTISLPEEIRLEPQSGLLLKIDRVTPDSIIIGYAHLDTLKCPE